MKIAKRPILPAFACPICNTKALVRTSVQITETAREQRMVCQNDDCDCSFVVQSVVSHMVRPSKLKNTAVALPVGNQNLRHLPKPERPAEPDLFSALLPAPQAGPAIIH